MWREETVMSIKLGIYKCSVCGNVVQVLLEGDGELVCCGHEMDFLEANYEENEIGEKHVPDIAIVHEGCESGVCSEVKYVSVKKHPMEKEHYIQFIEVYSKDKTELRLKFFKPDEMAQYDITGFDDNAVALELCNIHSLWRNKND